MSAVLPAFADDVPLPRSRPAIPATPATPAPWREPLSFREAAGADFQGAAVTSAPSECRQRLEKTAKLRPIPRLIGPGACGGEDMVELEAVLINKDRRIDIRPAPFLRCEMAEQFTLWVRDDVAARVTKNGQTLASVETYDDYSCRGRNRIFGAKLSEHGKGNAVDVRSITFTDKKSVLLTDKTFAKDVRTDLRASACARFTTVLGPGSDGYHEEHIHVDLAQRRGGFRMCQWNVLEPPPPPPPPPKPAEVAKADPKGDAKSEAKSEKKPDEPAPEEHADDADDAAAEPAKTAPIAIADVPLPRPRPAMKRKKSRGGVYFPFNLLR
ncbi:extensin family protein [Undibacter mobilis]|uniref:extensin-like domain-containing protein n=1 Tax=Undibacter mobilis TaxID=2292256 RepID=UPI00143DE1FB|nr:extensin family protein [Undibacter mobilis]